MKGYATQPSLAVAGERTGNGHFNDAETLEKLTRATLKLILAIASERVAAGKRCPLRILEIGSAEVAGWFSMGHYCTAVLPEPAEAIRAARRWPYVEVTTEPIGEAAFDIVIEGNEVRRVQKQES